MIDIKKAAIFVGLIVAVPYGLNTLLVRMAHQALDPPSTAKQICAGNKEAVEFSLADDEPLSRLACKAAEDAVNGRPQKETSSEYIKGYVYGLRLKCLAPNQSFVERDDCQKEAQALEAAG